MSTAEQAMQTGDGAQFTTPNRHAWNQAAAAVLRKAGRLAADAPDSAAWATLSRSTGEGITIPALGLPCPTDTEHPGPLPGVRDFAVPRDQGWDIRVPLVDQDPDRAASSALADLENGATSIWLTVGGPGTDPAQIAVALEDVLLELAPISLTSEGDASEVQAAMAFAALVRARGVSAAAGSNLGADPIGRSFRSGQPIGNNELRAITVQITELATELNIRGLVVDGTAAHDAGAGDAAELGYSMAVGLAYLRLLEAVGVDLSTSLRMIEFRYAATVDQFGTIAKFRAARALWNRVTELCGAVSVHRAQVQHAATSSQMMTRYDPWVNLLRTTVAAFAAGVAGADSVTVLPFDSALGVPDRFGRRMARNISSLLIHEAHVARVIDPVGGAYAIEAMTNDLAEAGWAEFQRIERAGGIHVCGADGSLLAGYRDVAGDRHDLIARRKMPITGISEFPHRSENLLQRPQPSDSATVPVTPTWAADFEKLRDDPIDTPVLLVTLGVPADHTVRAVYATNVLAAGGIHTRLSGPASSPDDAARAYETMGGPVVCLAGTNVAYGALGPQVITALRDLGASRVILTGRPAADLIEAVDDHIADGDDVLQFLQRTREHLHMTGAER